MKSRNLRRNNRGYTLVEMMLVVVILAILSSLIFPRFDILLENAYQAKARSSLGQDRTAIALYYADTEGRYPLGGYPEGNSFYVVNGISLSSVLVPKYISKIDIPKLNDRTGGFNGLALDYDVEAQRKMSENPPEDVFIVWGPPDYTPLLDSPFAYDNQSGLLYYSNGNYSLKGDYFYSW